MAKQTFFLFLRALLIGILLNAGLQFVADSSLSQQTGVAPQQVEFAVGQASPHIEVPFLDHVNN